MIDRDLRRGGDQRQVRPRSQGSSYPDLMPYIEDRVSTVETDIAEIKTRLGGIETSVGLLQNSVANLEQTQATMRDDVADLKAGQIEIRDLLARVVARLEGVDS
ncbi:hypothetical protein GCM10017559_79750 [Streptosporangium longisporum]|uniref:Uncharacterized protein n=2 Tax=Streptosporangium longisporum TaxID=46187 RepID=A0ABP6LET2_9ACTN